MELKERLTYLRQKNGLSQNALADAVGLSRQAISRWETGAAVPSTENLIRLSQLYGVPLNELVSNQPDDTEKIPPPVQISHRPIQWKKLIVPGLFVMVLLALLLISLFSLFMDRPEQTTDTNLESLESVDVSELGELMEGHFNSQKG